MKEDTNIFKKDNSGIKERLKEIRIKLGLKQEEISSRLGIANSTLSQVENGNSKPGFQLLYGLYKYYNVNLEYLMDGTGEMFHHQNKEVEKEELKKKYGDSYDDIMTLFQLLEENHLLRGYLLAKAFDYVERNPGIFPKGFKNNSSL